MGNVKNIAAAKGNKPVKKNAYADLGNVIGQGMGDLMSEGDTFAHVPLNRIRVKDQVRKEFERVGESTMDEMTASIKAKGVITPVLLRPIDDDPAYDYDLVAGERRYIGSTRAEKETIPAFIRVMTVEEAQELQMIENIHRLNLSMLEEANQVKKDLADLGSVDAVCIKYQKSPAWVSKILGMLSLPPETERLITEGITNDMEVIGDLKQVEKKDPALAKKTVEKLKATRGKEDARDISKSAKNQVKPAKEKANKTMGGEKATAKDLTQQLPGVPAVTNFAGAKKEGDDSETEGGVLWPFKPLGSGDQRPTVFGPIDALDRAYSLIFESGSSPKMLLETLEKGQREQMVGWLNDFYDAGKQATNSARTVIENLRKGLFSTEGHGAFAMVAFMHGADSNVKKFDALNVLGAVKA